MSFQALREKLPEFLHGHGINPNKKFVCIDPKHQEKTPSSHVYEGKIVKCFGCGKASDIFDVAHLIEGLPSKKSPNFFKDNVLVLARRFNIHLDDRFKDAGLDIYNEVMNYIKDVFIPQEATRTHITKENLIKSWAPVRYQELQLKLYQEQGLLLFVESPTVYQLRTYLTDKGFISGDLNQYGIVKFIFDQETTKYLYPLWDQGDYCVGFMKRQRDEISPKCLNVPNNPVFVKENYLYGLFFERQHQDLMIVEGQRDVIAVRMMGWDALGISFARITNMQFVKLLDQQARRYVLALDNDNSGQTGIIEGIEKFIVEGIIPWVYRWTHKDADEDYSEGLSIDEEKMVNGITFYIDMLDLESGNSNERIIRLLASIKSGLSRLTIVNMFAETLQIDKKYLLEDVDKYLESQKNDQETRILNIYKNAFEKLTTSPSLHDKIMTEAQQTINTLVKTKRSYDNEQVQLLLENSLKEGRVSKSAEDFILRPRGLEELALAMSENGIGWTTTGSFILSPGHSHTGKTLLITQAIAETLLMNEDSMVFLFSTDDSLELLVPRIVASIIAHPDYKIGYFYTDKFGMPAELFDIKSKAINLLYRLIKENRFVAKDVSYCKTFSEFADLVRYYKAKYPHRKAIVFNDNFHRNGDHREKEDLKRIEMAAGDIKNFAVEEQLAVWCSVEKRKQSGLFGDPGLSFNASNDDILGAGALVYYATHIIHTINDYVQRGKDIDACVWVHEYKNELLPQTQLRITKSKSNGNLANFICNMYPSANIISPTDHDKAVAIAHQRARTLGYI